MDQISGYLGSFNLSALVSKNLSLGSGSLFAILGVVVVMLIGLGLGRTRAMVSLLSVYIAFTLQTIFPFFGLVQKYVTFTDDLSVLRVAVFLAFYVIVFGILNNSVIHHRFTLSEASFFSVSIISILQLGLVVAVISNLLPTYAASHIPAKIIPYLQSQQNLFYWAVLPIVMIIFFKDKRRNY